jgi:ribosome recycling factor
LSIPVSRPFPGHLHRGYATKKVKSTADLVPGSKQPITDEAARAEYAKADEKMKAAVEWYRKECAAVESRATGRVTPAVLDPVRVKLPDSDREFRLDELATVGVRDGSTLLITIFQEDVRVKFCLESDFIHRERLR